jgi:hypothetical protein
VKSADPAIELIVGDNNRFTRYRTPPGQMKRAILIFACSAALIGCKSPQVVESNPPVAIQLNREASFKDGAPQTVRTELTHFMLDGYRGIARVYEFGGAKAGLEVIVFKRQPGPGLFPTRTDPSRFAALALLNDGHKLRAQFRPSAGPMNAGEVYDTDIAEFGPTVRLRDIDQVMLEIDGVRRSFRLIP